MANTNLATQLAPWNWFRSPGSSRYTSGSSIPATYFGSVSNFYRDIDQMFENVFNNFGMAPLTSAFGAPMLRPTIDIIPSDQDYTIAIETPGLSENDIKVSLSSDNTLIIRAEKQESEGQGQQQGRQNQGGRNPQANQRIERLYASFQRIIPLPDDIDPEGITANCENGVLTVTIPRRDQSQSQSRQIEINAGRGNEGTPRSSQREEGARSPTREGSTGNYEGGARTSGGSKKAA